MNKSDLKLIRILLIIIIIFSIIFIIKILKQKIYNEKLYAEIYSEYNEIFGDNSDIEAIESSNENKNEKTKKEYITQARKTADGTIYKVIASITIPKAGKSYPVISETTEEYMKIAPCKYWGGNPNEVGNLSIIGHNFKNSQFFSKINTLEKGDKVYLTSLDGETLEYKVIDKFEVNKNDLSCTEKSTNGTIDLTLITCTNSKSKRFIVKCRANI